MSGVLPFLILKVEVNLLARLTANNFFGAVLLFVPLMLCGCGNGPSYGPAVTNQAEDYPVENAHPQHVLQLKVTWEPRPRIGGILWMPIYQASQSAPMTCQKFSPFPIALDERAEVVELPIAVDHFRPGRCHWRFTSIYYKKMPYLSDDSLGYGRILLAQYDDRPDHTAREARLDIWCATIAKPGYYVCSSLDLLNSNFPNLISDTFLKSIPGGEWGSGGLALIGSNTTALTVVFHDLDSMPEAYNPTLPVLGPRY